jgi:hypothetical protein
MGGIFEKGLMIGFGFIILILFISMFAPIINLLIFDENEEIFDDLDSLAFTLDYGLNYYQNFHEETISFHIFLEINVTLDYNRVGHNTEILLHSESETLSLLSSKYISINILHIFGNLTLSFTYYTDIIYINFEMY